MSASCGCGRRWRGLAEAHCPTCHEQFSRVSNFDRHLVMPTGCRDPRKAGLLLGEDGVWRMPGGYDREAS